jgi:antitoxin MazE
MVLQIQKWGNSLALRIPMQVAREAKLVEGSEVNLTEQSGKIILDPLERDIPLSELLAKITDENLHDEQDFGAPRGKESW